MSYNNKSSSPSSSSFSSSSSSYSSNSSSSSSSSSEKHKRHCYHRRSRSRSLSSPKQKPKYNLPHKTIQSVIKVVNKPKEIKKGRGSFHQGESSGLLAWEDEDYNNANQKLINYGNKYKNNYRYKRYSKEGSRHNKHRDDDKGWKHDKFTENEKRNHSNSEKK